MQKLVIDKCAKWRGANEDVLGYEQLMWRKRAVAMASFLGPNDLTVMDLGAGNMCFSKLLGQDVKYIPVDYRKTSEETIVCDFNKHEFPDTKVDVINAAGILEYIEDPDWFLSKITEQCKKLIISYQGKEKFSYSALYTDDIIYFLRDKGFILTGRNYDFLDNWTLIGCFEKATPKNINRNQYCTGCGACVNLCPEDALELKYDSNGYYKPNCNTRKCIDCGRCVQVCMAGRYTAKNDSANIKTYAAWAPEEIRFSSSSGGVFSVLACKVIDDGGSVYGVSWDEKFIAQFERITDKESLHKIKYSKYSQANTLLSFRNVCKDLVDNKCVLYAGCPCQIAGLKSYLGKLNISREKLITVDLICFCAPSNQLFRRYLEEEYGLENVENVTFREKSALGWSPVGYRIDLKNGTIIHPTYDADKYQKVFHSVLARNAVCENCEYADFPRQGDITLGDFWGIEKYAQSWNDGMGTSAIIANSDNGVTLLNECIEEGLFERIEEVPSEWLRNNGNRLGKDGRRGHPGKAQFNHLLKKESFNNAVEKTLCGKFDVGMVAVFNRNIGNNLTNYALFQTLMDMGYETMLIDAPGKSNIDSLFLKSWIDFHYYQQEKIENYSELNDRCCQFLTASDQIWRYGFVNGTKYYTCLEFVKGNKHKASYATSTGVDYFEGDESEEKLFQFYLNRFQRISVREKSGAEYIKKCLNREIDHVMDPVFLCNYSHYEAMASVGKLRIPQRKYVAAYALDVTLDIAETIKHVADELTDGTYNLILDSELHYDGVAAFDMKGMKEPCVEEWIASIAGCETFVTDSFHGVCFALIFKKPFIVIFKKDNWRGYSRIKELLQALHLEERLVGDYDPTIINDLINKQINYEEVNVFLNKEIDRSINWLVDTIENGNSWHGCADTYDISKYAATTIYSNQMKNAFLTEERKTRMQVFMSGLKKVEKLERITVSKWEAESMILAGWGAGDCFLRNIELLKETCHFKFVCDVNPDKWGKEICGVECISPKQLSQMQDVGVIIFVDNPGICFDIADQLSSMGISRYDHVTNLLKALDGGV